MSTDELGQGPDLSAGKETDEATRFLSQNNKSGESSGYVLSLRRRAAPSEVALAVWALHQRAEERPRYCRHRGKRATPPRPLQDDDRQRLQEEPSPGPVHGRCRNRLNREAASSKPRSRARCTLVAKDVERTATGRCETKEEEEHEDDGRRTRKSTESNRW